MNDVRDTEPALTPEEVTEMQQAREEALAARDGAFDDTAYAQSEGDRHDPADDPAEWDAVLSSGDGEANAKAASEADARLLRFSCQRQMLAHLITAWHAKQHGSITGSLCVLLHAADDAGDRAKLYGAMKMARCGAWGEALSECFTYRMVDGSARFDLRPVRDFWKWIVWKEPKTWQAFLKARAEG